MNGVKVLRHVYGYVATCVKLLLIFDFVGYAYQQNNLIQLEGIVFMCIGSYWVFIESQYYKELIKRREREELEVKENANIRKK